MRFAIALSIVFLTSACQFFAPAPEFDRIEMRRSGWSALDVTIDRDGVGHYHLSEPSPDGIVGAFFITPAQFKTLAARLEQFRSKSDPFTGESIQSKILRPCPQGELSVTDAGAIWVRWISANSDRHYMLDLGCDPKRHQKRNAELFDIIGGLPIPRG